MDALDLLQTRDCPLTEATKPSGCAKSFIAFLHSSELSNIWPTLNVEFVISSNFFTISFSLSTFSSIGEQNVPLVKSESFDAEDYKSIELIGKNDVWIMLGKTDEVSWLVMLEIFEVFLMTFCYT